MLRSKANTILIADDFVPFRRIIRSKLQEKGFQDVAEASDGVEAVSQSVDLYPDLVLLDISMPNLDGIKAAAEIRSQVPEAKILFLSQYTDPDVVRSVLSEGAAGYLCKSGIERELLSAVEAVLSGKRYVCSECRRNGIDL